LFEDRGAEQATTKDLRVNKKRKFKSAPYQSTYEPTPAIALNEVQWRRWVRVKEWFSDIDSSLDKQNLKAAWNSILSDG